MRLHVIKHVPYEGPGAVAAWAQARGHHMAVTELGLGQPLPLLKDFDVLVLMGGPMSVHDDERYAWIRQEKALLRETMLAGKKMLGICLGAQMIASALGAAVTPNPQKEIGWFPVEVVKEGRDHPFLAGLPLALTVFHWHGETYALPPGAMRLWRSTGCQQQAYALGRQVLGLQCHPEVNEQSLKDMLEHGRAELDLTKPFIQSEKTILAQVSQVRELEPWIQGLLDNFAA